MSSKSKSSISGLRKSKIPDTGKPISIFSIVLNLLLILTPPILGLIWIMKLKKEKCLCSENWMREYINYYYIFIIIHSLLMIILTLIYGPLFDREVPLIYIFLLSLNIISYFIIVYYIDMLKYNKCKCSESIKRDILYVWHIIQIIFGFIALFTFIYIMYNNVILFK
jgi:hypothetical protein